MTTSVTTAQSLAQRASAPPAAARGKEQDIVYYTPVFQDVHLGGIPYDYVDSNPDPVQPVVTCSDNACGALPNEVHRNLPILRSDGTPRFDERHITFKERPYGPVSSFALWGVVGATAGGTIGLLAGAALGSLLPFAAGGALATGLVAGGAGAFMMRNIRHELQWDVKPLRSETFVGYRETVQQVEDTGEGTCKHHFTPILKAVDLGTYKVPRIVNVSVGPTSSAPAAGETRP